MVATRRGASTLGCLFTLLIVVAIGYFGFGVAEVYLRSYRFRDAMQTQARFARNTSDEAIRVRLRSLADSLGLPEDAAQVMVRRTAKRITISATYTETLELPGFIRPLNFSPSVSAGL